MPKRKITRKERNKILSWLILGAGTFIAIDPLLKIVKTELNPGWQFLIGIGILIVGAYIIKLDD